MSREKQLCANRALDFEAKYTIFQEVSKFHARPYIDRSLIRTVRIIDRTLIRTGHIKERSNPIPFVICLACILNLT